MKKIILIALILLSIGSILEVVKVGNNLAVNNHSATLKVESTNKEVLIPCNYLTATSSTTPLSVFVAGMLKYTTQ